MDPENYELETSTLTDRTTGLRFRLELLGEVGNSLQARQVFMQSACEKLPGNFRLPHWIELMTVVDYSGREAPVLIEPFDRQIGSVYYWPPVGRYQSHSRQFDSDDRGIAPTWLTLGESGASGPRGALCVESTRRAPAVTKRLGVEGETALDAVTGLRWQIGASAWNGGRFRDAEEYCSTLYAGGFSSGWRVPSLLELFTLRHANNEGDPYQYGVDGSVFEAVLGEFWSSTPTGRLGPTGELYDATDRTHWAVTFAPFELVTDGRMVRCVRSPD